MVAIIHCTHEIAEDVLLLCCWLCVICDVIDEIRARETLQSKFCRSAVLPVHFSCYTCVLYCAVLYTCDDAWRLMQDENYINFRKRMRMCEWKRERDWEGIFWAQVQGILIHKRHLQSIWPTNHNSNSNSYCYLISNIVSVKYLFEIASVRYWWFNSDLTITKTKTNEKH